jgi:polysaccharide biosynthesis protein PelD
MNITLEPTTTTTDSIGKKTATVAAPRARFFLGLRVLALAEICTFLLLALLVDAIWGLHNRFANLSPHPFWIIVVLISTYYGTREGLMAAAMASIALLFGNFPEQRIDELGSDWLLRATGQPLLWCLCALALGLFADTFRNRFVRLDHELGEARSQLATITEAYERLLALNRRLEARVVGQVCTVNAMYKASRAIDRLGIGEVLVGVTELVREVMNPGKFSLFLRSGSRLEAAANEGWTVDESFACDIDASSPLYEAIVTNRRFLVVTDPANAVLLGNEGLLAGPLINDETGDVVGMLKIESIGFLDLNWSNIQNFRIMCDWIGSALANAQRVENLQDNQEFVAQTDAILQ